MAIEYYIFIGMGIAVVGSAIVIGIIQNRKKPVAPPSDKPIDIPPPEPTAWSWKDRRPIAQIMLASPPQKPEEFHEGDRRWKLGGQFQFSREALLVHAAECIKNMKSINAQGMITWQIEGEEFFHSFSYIGDPSMLPVLAPEMEVLADEYFELFRTNGFKVGVCIRPDEIKVVGGWPHHVVPRSYFETLVRKIEYCKRRWGCTLFYVDSNIGWGMEVGTDITDGGGPLIPASIFAELSAMFPDCLIMPEHQDNEYYRYTAPYNDRDFRNLLSAEEKGFQVLAVDGFNQEQLTASVKQGNILCGRVWYAADELPLIKKAYDLTH